MINSIFGSTSYTATVTFNDGRTFNAPCQGIQARMGGSCRPAIVDLLGLFSRVPSNVDSFSIKKVWTSPSWLNRPNTEELCFSSKNQLNFRPQDIAEWIDDMHFFMTRENLHTQIHSIVDGIDTK